MTTRRNFHPDQPDADYLHDHILFTALIRVDLHNVGDSFTLNDACRWLEDAITKGLKQADPNDTASIVDSRLISRPPCQCYSDSEL